jgi:sec-independent protein translocase protein TatA
MYYLGAVSGGQIAIIAIVVVVLFFGGKKIPELMKGLGKGVNEFKNASKADGTGKEEESNKEEEKK